MLVWGIMCAEGAFEAITAKELVVVKRLRDSANNIAMCKFPFLNDSLLAEMLSQIGEQYKLPYTIHVLCHQAGLVRNS